MSRRLNCFCKRKTAFVPKLRCVVWRTPNVTLVTTIGPKLQLVDAVILKDTYLKQEVLIWPENSLKISFMK